MPDRLPPLDDQTTVAQLPPQPPQEGTGTLVAWVVIAVVTSIIFLSHYGQPAAQTSAATAASNALQARLVSRYAVGMHVFTEAMRQVSPVSTAPATQPQADGVAAAPTTAPVGPLSRSAASQMTPEQAIEQLDALVVTPPDAIRVAIVAGELSGAPAAIARLDAVLASSVDEAAATSPATTSPATQPAPAPIDLQDARALRGLYDGSAVLDDAMRAGLVERHGWFGRLALAYGREDDDPVREAAIWPAKVTAATIGAGSLMGVVAAIAGAVLIVLAFAFWRSGRMRPAYAPSPVATGLFLEAFAIYLAAMLLFSLALHQIVAHAFTAALIATALSVAAALAWPLARGCGWPAWRYAFGLHAGRGVFAEIVAGAAAYVAMIPLLILVLIVATFLSNVTGERPSHPIQNELLGSSANVAFALLLAAVWAPVTEELMFRGAFLHHVRTRRRWFAAAALVAIVFALIHPQGMIGVPAIFLIGMVLALVREWRGSIIAPITAHAINNGVLVTLALLLVA